MIAVLLDLAKWLVPGGLLVLPLLASVYFPAARRILLFSVPVPLFVASALGAWLWLDRESAVRRAVDSAVTEMVAGAEIAKLRATITAERQIAARRGVVAREAERRAMAAQAASRILEERLAEASEERETLHDEIEALLARPVDAACTVDAALLGRLRAR